MKPLEARALLFQRKLAYEDYNDPIPGIPELDGLLGLLELRASDTVRAEKMAKTEDGQDESLVVGGMIAHSLVLRESKEPIFSETDIEAIAGLGMSVLMPIAKKIKRLSGMDDDALAAAKKNSKKTTDSAHPTSSRATSEAAHAQS